MPVLDIGTQCIYSIPLDELALRMAQRSEAGLVEGVERTRPVDGGWLCLGCTMGSIWQLVVVLEDDLTHRGGAGEGGQQPECLHRERTVKLAGRPEVG